LNLLANAAQAMAAAPAPAPPTIVLSTAAAGARVRVVVRDNGPGIPAQDLARVFEPFFTTKRTGEGTGLGLAICPGIVEGRGARIHVDRPPGGGAVFAVELPIAAPAQSPPLEQADVSPARIASSSWTTSRPCAIC